MAITQYLLYSPLPLTSFYRGFEIIRSVYGFEVMCDGYEMAVVQFKVDEKWWIVPNENEFNNVVDAHGPFDKMEDAMLHLSLMGDIVQAPTIVDSNNNEQHDDTTDN